MTTSSSRGSVLEVSGADTRVSCADADAKASGNANTANRMVTFTTEPIAFAPAVSGDSGVVSRKFIEQNDELKWFEQQPSGAEARQFGTLYGTTESRALIQNQRTIL